MAEAIKHAELRMNMKMCKGHSLLIFQQATIIRIQRIRPKSNNSIFGDF